jgi:hypothetical protein
MSRQNVQFFTYAQGKSSFPAIFRDRRSSTFQNAIVQPLGALPKKSIDFRQERWEDAARSMPFPRYDV